MSFSRGEERGSCTINLDWFTIKVNINLNKFIGH
jgi:hypothetical protein